MNNYHSGHFAEFMALIYLLCKGYIPLRRNYITGRGTSAGEVDLILRRKKTLVFVEVKKRSNQHQAAYAIQPQQQKRIRKAAEAFIAYQPHYQNYDIRFDAVLIAFPLDICHIENAF